MKLFCTLQILLVLAVIYSTNALGGMPGGLRSVPVSQVADFLPKIEKFFNTKTKLSNYGVVKELVSAQSQVVAGVRYVIKFKLVRTDCKVEEVVKGLKNAKKDCNHDNKVQHCVADAIERKWDNNYSEVVEMKCDDVVTSFYE